MGHDQIHDDNVRIEMRGLADRFIAVFGFSYHKNIFLCAEKGCKSYADDGVVVCNKYSDFAHEFNFAGLSGSDSDTVTFVPAEGELSMVMLPLKDSILSRMP